MELKLTRITEKDITRFTCGDCNILAQELYDACDGKYKLAEANDGPVGLCGVHAFLKLDNKLGLDIYGVRPIKEITKRYGSRHKSVKRDFFAKEWRSPHELYPGSKKRAKVIAKHLLESVEKD